MIVNVNVNVIVNVIVKVDDTPAEVFVLQLKELTGSLSQNNSLQLLSLTVKTLQLDSHAQQTQFPVILFRSHSHSTTTTTTTAAKADPLLQLRVAIQRPKPTTTTALPTCTDTVTDSAVAAVAVFDIFVLHCPKYTHSFELFLMR